MLDFQKELEQVHHQVEESHKNQGNNMSTVYLTAYKGTHTIRLLRGFNSSSMMRVITRTQYDVGDGKREWSLNLDAVGIKNESLQLIKELKENGTADLSGRVTNSKRSIFFGQLVNSTNRELLNAHAPDRSILLFMVPMTIHNSINSAIASGCDAATLQDLVTGYNGPTITITKGDKPNDLSASLGFVKFQSADSQVAMDELLGNLEPLDSKYYNAIPTQEEVNKAIAMDQNLSKEIRARYYGGSVPQSITPQQVNYQQSPQPQPQPQQSNAQWSPTPTAPQQLNQAVAPQEVQQPKDGTPPGVEASQTTVQYTGPSSNTTSGFVAPDPAGWNPNNGNQ